MTKRIPTPEPNEAERAPIQFFAEALAAILIALAPLKFTEMTSVPEMPPAFRFDVWSIATGSWPTVFFSMASVVLLALSLAAALRHRGGFAAKPLAYGGLWILLAASSLLGWKNASCLEYAVQAIAYALSLGACIVSFCLLSSMRSGFRRILIGSLLTGAFLAVLSGFDQYFHQFDLMEDFLNEPGRGEVIQGNLRSRALERRVFGNFNVANTYAGYLASLLPLVLAALWTFGNQKVSPPKLSRRLLSCLGFAAIGFLLAQTQSRGAFFVLLAAAGLTVLAIPASRKARVAAASALVLCVGAFAFAVFCGRGPLSMLVRFDYFQAAFRMMAREPFAGTGWGDFFHDYLRLRAWTDSEASHTPHDFPLLFGSQCGIPGLLAALGVWLFPVWEALREGRRLRWNDAAGFRAFAPAFGALVLSLDFLLEIAFETPACSMTLAALALATFDDSERGRRRLLPVRVRIAAFLPLGAALFCASAVATWTEFRSERAQSALFYALDPAFSLERNFQIPPPDRVALLLERAKKDAPRSPFPLAKAAGYFLGIGRPATAAELLEEAKRLSPENPALRLFSIQARFAATGELTEAMREELALVRAMSPKNPEYRKSDEELVRIPALEKKSP